MNSEKARPRAGFAVLVAAGILLSRIAGLIRERLSAHYLGSSSAADAFKAAFKIPNFLQNLLGEGVLSASFIPVYAKLLAEKDEKLAGRVAGVFASILALAVSVLVLIGVLVTPYIIDLISPGFEGDVRLLTIRIVRILFPGAGILVLSAWCLGILNSHHKFFLSYVAPVLWNAAMITTLVIFGTRLRQNDLAVALAWGMVIGSVLQFGIQVPFVFRYARYLSFGLDRFLEPVRDIFRTLGPVVMSRGVVQLSAYIDQIIASYLPEGAVSSLAYSQTIYLLPISLFGMSVAAAELPQMSREQGEAEQVHGALRKRLERGLRQIAFFVIPTVVAFVLIGRILVAALYQTGQFGPEQTRYVWYILIGSTVGLLAMTLGRLYSSAFYALRDTRTPFWFATARVALTAALGYLFAFPLRWILVDILGLLRMPLPAMTGGEAAMGVVGLTASAGIAGWLEFLLLRSALQKRIGAVPFPISFQLRVWSAAIAAGAGSLAFAQLISFHHIIQAVLVCGVFGLIYFGVATVMGVPEARATLGRFLLRSRS
ncbi:MAG TPA: murein biosynthesis integral membrane protein MurJ [Thermoanaerobaculia bacterium]